MNPTTDLTKLQQQQTRASSRIGNLEGEQRRAAQTLAAAREALAQLERRGGAKQTERDQLEQALAEAKAEVAAPWPERIEGANRAARDAQQAVQLYAAQHLSALVAEREQAGAAKAAEFNTHIEAAVRVYPEVQRIANEISALASLVGTVQPGDVSRTRAERLYNEMNALLLRGGEVGPQLLRDPQHVEQAEEVLA